MTVDIKYTDLEISCDTEHKGRWQPLYFSPTFLLCRLVLFCSKRAVNFAVYNQKYWFSASCQLLPNSLVFSLQVQEADLSYSSLGLYYFDRLNIVDDFLRSKLGARVLKFIDPCNILVWWSHVLFCSSNTISLHR